MSVTIITKDVGEVRDVFRKELEFKWQDVDGIAEHRKRDIGVDE